MEVNNSKKILSAGSDKVGYVYEQNGNIYRVVNKNVFANWKELFSDPKFLNNLYNLGLIRSEVINSEVEENDITIQHKKIDFVSFYKEWSFDMLKDAALTTINLAIEFEQNGYCLHDAHPYNILFDYSKPTFVDFSSIKKNNVKISYGWKRGFFSEFIIPLIFLSKGFKKIAKIYFYWEDNPAQKLKFNNIFMKLWFNYNKCFRTDNKLENYKNLYAYVMKIEIQKYTTKWENYYGRDTQKVITDDTTWSDKEKSSMIFLRKLKSEGMETLLDIASNEGWFSLAAEKIGYKVVAFDYDERAINNLYLRTRNSMIKILPIVMNFTKPTREHGINKIWKDSYSRLACDVTLSMAILHHLALRQNITFQEYANKISLYSKNYAVVEFIGREDVHIQKWLKEKDWYTEENFLKAMKEYFQLLDRLPSNPKTRTTFLFKKKTEIPI